MYIDPQSRPIRSEGQTKENNQWKTEHFVCVKYNEPIDPILFQPNFSKDVKIIDADKVFDEFVDLKKTIYTEQRNGLIFAIHRIERFENGGMMYVASVRGTEETLKKYPIAIHTGQDQLQPDGPAVQGSSHSSTDGLHKKLAWVNYQGIDIGWWAIIPYLTKPNYLEVAPNKIKLNVNVFPDVKFRESLTEKQLHTLESGWDIVVDYPRPTAIYTVEEIAKSVYADLANLHGIRLKNLASFDDDHHAEKNTNIIKISSNEYAKKIVRDVKWEYEDAIYSQIDEQFEPKKQQEIRKGMGDRVAVALMYNPEVRDATLERVGKRDSATELYLQGTRITDDGLKQLSGLKNLQILHLEETGVTDAGLNHLTGLVNLKHLYLTDTKVTAEGVAMLKQAIPKIEIKWKERSTEYEVRSERA